MKKIDRYVLTEITGPFFGGLLFFIFIFLMFQTLRLAEFFIVHGIPGGTVVMLAVNLAVSFLPMALPLSLLIGIIVGFGRLSADSELVAIKASGVSLSRITVPVFGFSTLVVGLSLFLNLHWVPMNLKDYWRTIITIGNTRVVSSIHEGTFTSGFFDMLIFAGRVDSKTSDLKQVFIYDERDAQNPMTIVAKEGKILPVKSDSSFGTTLVLRLDRGNIHKTDVASESYQKVDFDEYRLFLDSPGGQDTSSGYKTEMLTISELYRQHQMEPAGSHSRIKINTEIWKRLTVAASAWVFVLLGVGSGTVRTRSPRSGAALITLAVVLIYWTSMIWAQNLSSEGKAPAELIMHIPNLIIFVAGIWAFRRSART